MRAPVALLVLLVLLGLLLAALPAPAAGNAARHPSDRIVDVLLSRTLFADASFSSDAVLYPMRTEDGSRFMCLLPPDDVAVEDRLMQFHEDAKARHGLRVPSLVVTSLRAELAEKCFQTVVDWWAYELCWEKHVRQYHPPTSEIMLGVYPAEAAALEEEEEVDDGVLVPPALYGHDHRGAYISTVYTQGNFCDTTPDHRVTEVRLYCDKGDVADPFRVVEVGTCKYLALLFTPEACAFDTLEEPSINRRVVCYPL